MTELDEVKKLLDGATPGPWENTSPTGIHASYMCINGLSALFTIARACVPDDAERGYTDDAFNPDTTKSNARFIAAARSLVPAMAQEIADLLAERDAALAEVARLSTPPDDVEVAGLVAALRTQRQIDMDGCEVAVSRQACDEAADAIEHLQAEVARLSTPADAEAHLTALLRAEYERGKAETNALWSRNSRDTFEAMCAMRDAINEHVPMPSLESDLLQGPEASVFCAAVAEAVIGALLTQEGR
jgi:hypothetical protein